VTLHPVFYPQMTLIFADFFWVSHKGTKTTKVLRENPVAVDIPIDGFVYPQISRIPTD